MARKPKNGTSGPTETVATTLLMPTPKKVQDLARIRRRTKKQAQEIVGEYGNAVANAVENNHVDRKALSIAVQLDGMSDEKLHVTYFHLLRYLDDLGVVKRATSQEEMFEEHRGKPAGEAPEEEEESEAEGNVTRLGTAARRVAEQAGGPA